MDNKELKAALQTVGALISEESARLQAHELKRLYEPIAYILNLGGKRLRPLVAYLTYKHFAGDRYDATKIAPVIKAVELFHNFTLLHDDLMDDAPVRRGLPTVYKKWGANTAILSGDAMVIEAYKALAQLDGHLLPDLLDVFNRMALGVCEGQQLDMDYEQRDPGDLTINDYIDMIRLKTSYLFKGSMVMGAMVAGLEKSEIKKLDHAAERMGLAFQVMDDYLDVFSDKPDFGKVKGGDIVEGKRTWLLLKAYELDPEALSPALNQSDESRRIAEVTQVYRANGIDRLALAEVERYTQEAIEILRSLQPAPDSIIDLFESLVRRIV